MTFDADLRLILSPRLKAVLPQKAVAECFGQYEGQPLTLPEDAVFPEPSFLAMHREVVFQRS